MLAASNNSEQNEQNESRLLCQSAHSDGSRNHPSIQQPRDGSPNGAVHTFAARPRRVTHQAVAPLQVMQQEQAAQGEEGGGDRDTPQRLARPGSGKRRQFRILGGFDAGFGRGGRSARATGFRRWGRDRRKPV